MRNYQKKFIAIGFLIPFINLGFFIFRPEVYFNLSNLIILISFTLILSLDIAIRPISKNKDQFKYNRLSIVLFLLLPFFSLIPYLEFKLLIQIYLVLWNNYLVYFFGALFLILGSFFLIYSRILLGKYASSKIVIEKNHVLITNGIYKYIRHPIYLGMLLIFIGYALAFKTIISPLTFLTLFFLIFNNRMNLEEKLLVKEFGKEYEVYLKKTKRIIPFIY